MLRRSQQLQVQKDHARKCTTVDELRIIATNPIEDPADELRVIATNPIEDPAEMSLCNLAKDFKFVVGSKLCLRDVRDICFWNEILVGVCHNEDIDRLQD
ncbi:hypothetical protein GN244_ATG07944 [Phytophthora infestans]|uniref:Uncharacterized protein n=1 Tax=Phytophthora infestans TaxID=4787 RepID=A0A833TF46_PHYIN|nr:hypothetical protein GN244_ATG07944 [Phytophthora infestans]